MNVYSVELFNASFNSVLYLTFLQSLSSYLKSSLFCAVTSSSLLPHVAGVSHQVMATFVYFGCKQTIVHLAQNVWPAWCAPFCKRERTTLFSSNHALWWNLKIILVVWKGRLCKRKQYFAHVSCCEKGRKKKLIVFLAFNKRCFLRLSCFSWETFLHQWQILSILTSTENTNTQLEALSS